MKIILAFAIMTTSSLLSQAHAEENDLLMAISNLQAGSTLNGTDSENGALYLSDSPDITLTEYLQYLVQINLLKTNAIKKRLVATKAAFNASYACEDLATQLENASDQLGVQQADSVSIRSAAPAKIVVLKYTYLDKFERILNEQVLKVAGIRESMLAQCKPK